MNPYAQLSASLVVTLALSFPSLAGAFRAEVRLPDAAIRCVVAFVLARGAIHLLDQLVRGYAATLPVPGEGNDAGAGENACAGSEPVSA